MICKFKKSTGIPEVFLHGSRAFLFQDEMLAKRLQILVSQYLCVLYWFLLSCVDWKLRYYFTQFRFYCMRCQKEKHIWEVFTMEYQVYSIKQFYYIGI